jgi:hypothetical protein
LSLALLTVTQGSQTFTGRQALAMSTAQTLATLDIAQRTGPNLREAPVFGLDDAVFTNPLISGQKISLRQLVERMRENTGYDPLAHLQPLPQQWRINDVNALIDGINQALQPTTTVSLVSFNFVNADGLTLTAQQAYAYSLLKTLNSAGTSSVGQRVVHLQLSGQRHQQHLRWQHRQFVEPAGLQHRCQWQYGLDIAQRLDAERQHPCLDG